MATKKTIEVTINPEGEVNIEVSGFDDGGCLAETSGLEKALGTVTNRKKKSEAYIQPENKVKLGK